MSFRKPIDQDSQGECRSPYQYRDISDTARVGGDYLELIADQEEGGLSRPPFERMMNYSVRLFPPDQTILFLLHEMATQLDLMNVE